MPPGNQRLSWPAGQRSLGRDHGVARAVAKRGKAGQAQRRDHQLAALSLGRGIEVLVEDLADELPLVDVQAVTLQARPPERARLGEPGVVDADGTEALLDPGPQARQRAARLAGAENPVDRFEGCLETLLEGDLEQVQGVGGRAPQRRRLDL